MATLTSSVRADVPAVFADREWNRFMRRSLFDSSADGQASVATTVRSSDAREGTVAFRPAPDQAVTITVELDVPPSGTGEPVSQAQARLDRDLERFRSFVERRCDETHCHG